MKKNKIIREPINIEEVKEAEIEEKKEEIKELKKELANFSTENELPTRAKEDLTENKKSIEKILKLKCNYEFFKKERIANEMFVSHDCQLCNKNFKNNDDIYCAITKQGKQLLICKNCAEN